MDKTIPTVMTVAIIVIALTGMYLGWRARQKGQAGFPLPSPVPVELGSVLLTAKGMYLVTTLGGQPLERIAAHGLGYRAKVKVTVAATGVALDLSGEEAFFIPVTDLRRVQRASWTIDHAVEPGGLLCIGWQLGGVDVDSYLRIDGTSEAIIEAITGVLETAL